MAVSPYTDPAAFWSRVFVRLGLVLAVLAAAPAVIDFFIFKGAAVTIAVIALFTLAPLALLSLLTGIGVWIAGKLRK